MSSNSIFVILVYFHIQLFQIYLSAAEMEHRLISYLAFPQEGEIYLYNRISFASQFTYKIRKYIRNIE